MRDINNYARSYAKGKSFEFTEWSKLNNYTNSGIKQDFVTYGGSLYACICDVAAGNESPDKDMIHWKLAVAGSFTERKDLIKLLGFEPVNPNITNSFTKSQTFNAGINLNNTQIKKVKNPENGDDAANKQYVDTKINSIPVTKGTGIVSIVQKGGGNASAESSSAFGLSTASGSYSHSEGYRTKAEGTSSHAEGDTAKALGNQSHAEGRETQASGDNSHAEGYQTKALQFHSHAEGYGTEAKNYSEHAEGSFNVSHEHPTLPSKRTVHSVGIGTSVTDRRNATEIMKNGDVYVLGIGGYDGTNLETAKTVQTVKQEVANAVQITYTELKYLRDTGKLVPGTQYRIIDYTCTTTQSNTKSAGHVFDIIVTADDESTLNEEAKAIMHTGDTYFANSNLSAWKIWYCLDNDTDRFTWANPNISSGELIIDTINSAGSRTYKYDVPISKITYDGKTYNLEIGVKTDIFYGPPIYVTKTNDYTLVVEDEYNYITNMGRNISVYSIFTAGKGVIYRMIDEFNNDVPYDFKNIQFKKPTDTTKYPYYYYTFASDNVENNTDHSLDIINKCYSNIIRECIIDGKRSLNKILFIGSECYSNSFGPNNLDNFLGYKCRGNSFNSNCKQNSLYDSCSYNIFADGCNGNTLHKYCNYNMFGSCCVNNTIYDSGNKNSFGAICRYNSLDSACTANSFGNGCEMNNLAKYSDSNSFGNNCINLTFESSYYRNNHFGDSCQYITFKGVGTASEENQIQNYNFSQGLQGNYMFSLSIVGFRNRLYETKVENDSNGELKSYCAADIVDLICYESNNSDNSYSYYYSTSFIGEI